MDKASNNWPTCTLTDAQLIANKQILFTKKNLETQISAKYPAF
jgi:hypothetical protein